MTDKFNRIKYFENITSYNRLRWIFSAIAAVGLNLLLFMLMPQFMDQAPSKPAIDKVVPGVSVTRPRQPDQPKPERKKPEKKQEEKPEIQKRAAESKPEKPELKRTFDINPRLPGGPDTLDLPPMEPSLQVRAPDKAELFSRGELDAPLTVQSRVPPVYPMRAKRLGIEGWVEVSFIVDKQGKVGQIEILDADPEGVFEKSVKQCVSNWRFNPGTVEGMPVKTKVKTKIRFQLD